MPYITLKFVVWQLIFFKVLNLMNNEDSVNSMKDSSYYQG